MNLKNLFGQKARENKNLATKDKTREMGVEGEVVFDGFENEQKRLDKISIEDYRKMRDTDATIDSLFKIITMPIIADTADVKADDDDENEIQAEFVRNSLFEPSFRGGMDTPFRLVLEQMLHAIFDGFALFERVYKIDASGRLTLKKLARRDAKTVELIRAENGEYSGAHQITTFGAKQIDVILPAEKTFLFTYDKASDYLYGRSAFRAIYRNWDKKQKLEYLDSVAIQSGAIFPKLLKKIGDNIVKNDTSISKTLRQLSKLGELKSTMTLPEGFDVSELKGGSNQGIHESIERQNSEMAREFLANFMLAGTQGAQNVGSYNLSSNQSNIFMMAMRGIMNLVEEHINNFWIADLIDLNFPLGKRFYPEFKFDDLTTDTVEFMKAAFTKLIEKDRVSDETVVGIEKNVATRLGIGLPEDLHYSAKNPEDNSQDAQNSAEKIDDLENSENNSNDNSAKEDLADSADKFREEKSKTGK